jgi:hypothetical protein
LLRSSFLRFPQQRAKHRYRELPKSTEDSLSMCSNSCFYMLYVVISQISNGMVNRHFNNTDGLQRHSKRLLRDSNCEERGRKAYCSGRAVYGMKFLRFLEPWDRGFEYRSRYGCLFVLDSGLAMGRSPVQEDIPNLYRIKRQKKGPGSKKEKRL